MSNHVRNLLATGALVGLAVTTTVIPTPTASAAPGQPYQLTILHHNDGESQLLNAPGNPDYGGVARFKTLADQLKAEADPTDSPDQGVIMITAGDNFLAGPELQASFDATDPDSPLYDAIALREIGYDAMVVGNHDLDFGPDVLAEFITDVNDGAAPIPFLSSNLDVAAEPGLAALEAAGLFADSTVIDEDGHRIAVIGATTELLPAISTPRNIVVEAVASNVQAEIDALTADGVDLIILSAHLQGLDEDINLISQLDGLDIAVAGGGDELLSNGEPLVPGDTADGRPYPVLATDASGDNVPLVTSDGDYKYIGKLVVDLDANGDIVSATGGPVRVSGVDADAVAEDPIVKADVTDPVAAFVAGLATQVIATSEVPLNGTRLNGIRTRETNEGNLVADAFRWQAGQALGTDIDVAFANGGGIRNNNVIPAGDITALTTFDILPFTNTLGVIEALPRDAFKAVLENAYSRVEFTDGRFAQLSGVSVLYDPFAPPGNRVLSATLDDGTALIADGAVVPGDPISAATVDFLARGGDEYPLADQDFTLLSAFSYQAALFNYITASAYVGGLAGQISEADYPVDGEGRVTQAIKINEFVFNHTGADTDEFIEVVGVDGLSYDQYSLVVVEGDSPNTGTIDDVFPLGTAVAGPDGGIGFWTTGLLADEFENGSNTVLLVKHFTGAPGDDLDTDDDGTPDVAPWAVLVDDVAIDDGGADDLTYSSTVLSEGYDGNAFAPGGASRIPDATDTDTTADWVRNDFGGFGLPSFPAAATPDAGIAVNTPGTSNTTDAGTGGEFVDVTIPELQGGAHLSPFDGQPIRTSGIVTAVAFNGFYLQDANGDGDDTTSDGVFVFGFADDVAIGDAVTVEGAAAEFIPGGADTGNLSTTQVAASAVVVDSTGNALPAPVVIGRSGRIPPAVIVISDDELPTNLQTDPAVFNPETDAIDFYEAVEGMLVTVEQPVAVSATRAFNAFSSEFFVLANDGADAEPADVRTSRGGIALQPDDENPERVQIQIDGTIYPGDASPSSMGDKFGDITGVVGYSFGNFEVNATQEITLREESGLVAETTALVGGDDSVTVASYNVLNLSPDASDTNQMATVGSQIANNLGAPDVVALQEIQDNSGETDDGVTAADATLQALVDSVAAAGGPTYEFAEVAPEDGAGGGVPGGNIRNAFLYNPDRVSLVELTSLVGLDAFAGSRDPLVGTFEFTGAGDDVVDTEFTVVDNHFSSRFGSTPIFGGPQPFVQAGADERIAQAQAVNDYVDGILATDADANVLVTGDFNTFQWTSELTDTLPGPEPILTNLIDSIDDDAVYSFVFEGNSQVLDHAFVTDALVDDAVVDIVHVNVDFPYVDDTVGSDHEPLVTLLTFDAVEPVDTTPPVVEAELVTIWKSFFGGSFVADYLCTDDVGIARCRATVNGNRVDDGQSVFYVRSSFSFAFQLGQTLFVFGPRLKLRVVGIDFAGNRTVATDVARLTRRYW